MSYPFASLTSGLLARKGGAQPAMASHSGGNPLRMAMHEPRVAAPIAPAPTLPAAPTEPAVMRLPLPASPAPAIVKSEPPVFRPAAALQKAGYAFEPGPPPLPVATAKSALPMREIDTTAPSCGGSAACGVGETGADPARRFHVSVRLRQSHFVRLKIASAQLRKPSQDIVAEALEAHFRSLDPNVFGDCACARS